MTTFVLAGAMGITGFCVGVLTTLFWAGREAARERQRIERALEPVWTRLAAQQASTSTQSKRFES